MWSPARSIGTRAPPAIADPHHEPQLELDVELPSGAPGRPVARGVGLAAWPDHGRPAHHHRAGPPVVPDGQVPPVRQEGLGVRPEHAAHVRGVLDRRVEVDEVPDLDREEEVGLGHRHQQASGERGNPEHHPLPGRQQVRDTLADRPPRQGPQCQEAVQRPRVECVAREGHAEVGEQPLVQDRLEVEDLVADGDPGPRTVSRPTEQAEREVLDGEVALLGDVDPGPEVGVQRWVGGGAHPGSPGVSTPSATRSSTGSSTLQLP